MSMATLARQQWQRLAPGDRRSLVIVSIFLSIVFGYVGLIEPLLIRYDSAGSELEDLLTKQRRYSRQITMLPRREARLAEYRAELEALNRRFNVELQSTEAALSRTISELTYYARLCEIAIASMRPLEPQPAGDYIDIPFEMEASGSYEGLRKFFYYIDTSPSLLAITRLDLSQQDRIHLQASLQISDIVRLSNDEEAGDAAPTARQDRLRLVTSQWTGYAPLIVAQRNGYLDSDRYRIDFVPVSDNVTVERLLLAGEVDGIGTTIPELLNYWVKGVPLTVIMPLSNSAGTEGIVVRADSPIKTVADLRGYPVAVDEQGILLFLLFNALRQENMTLDEIQRRSLEAVQVSRDIMSGTLEAGVTREPYLSALLATRQARLIYDSQPLQGLILDMLAINPEVAGEKAGVLQFLIDGLLRAQRFISEQPDQTLGIIADWRDQTPEEMQNQVARITFFDNDTTRTFFDSRYLQELLKVFEDYFQATSQPFPLVTFEDIIDASFVENAGAAAAEIPNGTPLEQEHAER